MTIGEKIKRLRKENGITQEELGSAIGVKKAAINKYETGVVVNLKKTTIESLARALDVNPVWLMDEADGWPPVPSTRTLIARAAAEDLNVAMADDVHPKTSEARIISGGIDKLPKEQREQALKVLQAVFSQYADYFKKESDTDENDT